MRTIASLLCNLLSWLHLVPRPIFTTQFTADHPDTESMSNGHIYIVGGKKYSKWAYFRCPADQDEIVQLSLMPQRRPCWTVSIDFLGRPTISPSIRQTDGSYAHFWVKKGAVIWCADSGHFPSLKASQSGRQQGK